MAPTIIIKSLKAGHGDSILISFHEQESCWKNILIDGGNGYSLYKEHLREVVEFLAGEGQFVDLLIVTHIDQDHIKGILYLIRDIENGVGNLSTQLIKTIWFNSARQEVNTQDGNRSLDISVSEMQELEEFLRKQPDDLWDIKDLICHPSVRMVHGASLTILSPNKESITAFIDEHEDLDIGAVSDDYSRSLKELFDIEKQLSDKDAEELDIKTSNASSIAFLFEYKNISFLHLGDATPKVIDETVEELLDKREIPKLKVDAIKLSHHASKKSISFKFLSLVSSNKYIISTNGRKAKLPNKATFAKILMNVHRDQSEHMEFYFNYPGFSSVLKFTDEEKAEWNFSCHDANFEHGYCLPL